MHNQLVGRARGVEFAEWAADGFRALYEADARSQLLRHFRQLFCCHDARAVHLGEFLLDVGQVACGHVLEFAMHEVGAEGIDLPLTYRFVL